MVSCGYLPMYKYILVLVCSCFQDELKWGQFCIFNQANQAGTHSSVQFTDYIICCTILVV